jgi:hypothetical protein
LKRDREQNGKIRQSGLDASKARPYVRTRNKQMSERLRRVILQIEKEMKDNEPIVKKLFKQAGFDPDPIVVSSVLKYHKTLKKLAKE